jgi:hypothetical protein
MGLRRLLTAHEGIDPYHLAASVDSSTLSVNRKVLLKGDRQLGTP